MDAIRYICVKCKKIQVLKLDDARKPPQKPIEPLAHRETFVVTCRCGEKNTVEYERAE